MVRGVSWEMPSSRSLEELVEEGKWTWFFQDPSKLSPILAALGDMDQEQEGVRAWRRYFEAVQLHYQKQFRAADEAFKALLESGIDLNLSISALIGRNRAVIANVLAKADPEEGLRAALEQAIETGDLHTQGTIEYNLGLTYQRFGRDDEALTVLTKAIEHFDTIGDRRGVFHARESQTYTDAIHDDPRLLHAELDRMQELADALDDLELQSHTSLRKGQIALEAGRYHEALAMLETSLGQFQAMGTANVSERGSIEFMMANTYGAIGDLRSALEWAYRSMDSYKETETWIATLGPAAVISGILGEMGRYEEALRFSLQALSTTEEIGNPTMIADTQATIGYLYTQAGDPVTGLEWLERARKTSEDRSQASIEAMLHIGLFDANMTLRDLDAAAASAQRLVEILPAVTSQAQQCMILAIAGMEAVRTGKMSVATAFLEQLSSHPLTKESRNVQLDVLMLRGLVLEAQGKLDEAIEVTIQRVEHAEGHLMRSHEFDAHQRLLHLFKAKMDVTQFFQQFEKVDDLRAEIHSAQQQRQLALMSIEREYEEERVQSVAREQLLNNVLPEGIAERLLSGEGVIADDIDNVAVIFLDLVSFTDLASKVPPGHVIHMLNAIFQTCDEVMRQHGITKIKTIGDAYLAVAGAPKEDGESRDAQTNVARAATAVLALRKELDSLQITMPPELGETDWVKHVEDIQVRIGCHVGSVVAGVVGTDRVAYDVWGDAVNIAARMEQTCEPGRIQVSDDFAKALPDASRPEFDENDRVILRSQLGVLEQRGNIPIKGKGDIKTWWLV